MYVVQALCIYQSMYVVHARASLMHALHTYSSISDACTTYMHYIHRASLMHALHTYSVVHALYIYQSMYVLHALIYVETTYISDICICIDVLPTSLIYAFDALYISQSVLHTGRTL